MDTLVGAVRQLEKAGGTIRHFHPVLLREDGHTPLESASAGPPEAIP